MKFLFALLTAGIFSLTLEVFQIWDWGQGFARGIFLVLFIIGFFLLLAFRKEIFPPLSKRRRVWEVVAFIMLMAVIALNTINFVNGYRTSKRMNDGVGDQHQCAVRALKLFSYGVNPYGRRSLLDIPTLRQAAILFQSNANCGEIDWNTVIKSATTYWKTLSLEQMDRAVPTISASWPECQKFKRLFESLGYKYGPALLLVYWPFVSIFGPAGVLVAEFLAAFVLGTLIFFSVKERASPFYGMLAVLIVFEPSFVRWNSLYQGHSDLIPTLFAFAGFFYWTKHRNKTAAGLIGLSVAAKTFPGLLLVPLLWRNKKDSWPFFLVMAGFYLPFAFWDPIGMQNYWLFPLSRLADSTSFVAAIPVWGGNIVVILSAIIVCFFLWRALYRPTAMVNADTFLVVTFLLAYLCGKQFHNNYLVWVLPFIGNTLGLPLSSDFSSELSSLRQ